MILPSLNATRKICSETSTPMALVSVASLAEVSIPLLRYLFLVFLDDLGNARNLRRGKSTAALQPNRTKPIFRNFVVSLRMDMHGFVSVGRVEKEPIRPLSQYCWHPSLRRFGIVWPVTSIARGFLTQLIFPSSNSIFKVLDWLENPWVGNAPASR